MRLADVVTLREDRFDTRPHRLIIPLGDFGDEVPDTLCGAVTEFVTELSDAVRGELNMYAPEMAQWWSAPTVPYGPARVRQHNQPALGLLPNKWFDLVGGLVESGLDWCERVVLICGTLEQTHILRDHIPLLREFDRDVVFCYIPPAEVTPALVELVTDAILDNFPSINGELFVTV